MVKTFIQPGEHVTIPASAATASGDGVLEGALFGVALHDAASGADLTLGVVGVYELPKASGEAWTVGARLYWDGTEATTTAAGNTLIGAAVQAAGSAATTGRVRLNGTVA